MSAYDQLVRACDELDLTVQRYAEEAAKAADAESTHKHARARRVLEAQANGARSVSQAETEAEADDSVAGLYLQRLASAAVADASKQRIVAIRERIGALRSYLADQRASDQLHAQSGVRS